MDIVESGKEVKRLVGRGWLRGSEISYTRAVRREVGGIGLEDRGRSRKRDGRRSGWEGLADDVTIRHASRADHVTKA
jgi:hypothetical protein